MKYAISFFGVLVILISGLLFFQYQVYSDKLETSQGEFSYTQEIEITYRSDSLDVRQHFKNLPNQEIDIQWPKQALNLDCFIDSETSCKRLNEDKTKFKKGETYTQSVSYLIPLEGGLKSNQLLKDIFVQLSEGKVTYSTIHISTDNDVSGQWVTGLPLIGQQNLSLVNYAMFSGTGPVTELYWNSKNLALQEENDLISIFSSKPITNDIKEELQKLKLLNDEHIAVVHGLNTSNEQGNRILFLKDLSIDTLKSNVILSQAMAMYNFNDSPKWISEVVASFLTGDQLGGSKSMEIVDTLTHQMSEDQLSKWIAKLEQLKGKNMTPEKLDETLSDVFGIHTEYFTLNRDTNGVFPFLFNDVREVSIDANVKEDVDVIFKDGLVYYSADSLLKHLGYDSLVGKNGYYVNNEVRSFRFPKNYGFYVYNERRYNTVSEPIEEIAGHHFIEETWLQRLFLVEIEKNKDTISISTVAAVQQ